jgi:hypothetical protein
MAKLRGCRVCFVDMQEIALADGSVVLFCAACDTMADERHVTGGARCWPAGMARKPLKLVVNRLRPALVKKISYPGKKSLTA